MKMNNQTKIIQITSGRGPAECCWVVAQLLKVFINELKKEKIEYEILHKVKGQENRTLSSVLLQIKGKELDRVLQNWLGTIQWIGQSPFRKFHKRKNWFVGIAEFENSDQPVWNESDLRFEAFRSNGAGGQHVNKVESAVRAIHVPTGTAVVARESRSQHQNKKLAIERLKTLIESHEFDDFKEKNQDKWLEHIQLERGNPTRIYKGEKFQLIQTF